MVKMKFSANQNTVWLLSLLLLGQTAVAAPLPTDKPSLGFSTYTLPQGQMMWEQTLQTDHQQSRGSEQTHIATPLLWRAGIGHDLEVRLAWDGVQWYDRHDTAPKEHEHGLGDVTLGIKKAMQTNDEQFKWALLAQANLANGDDEFSVQEPIYTVGSSIAFQYSPNITTGMTMLYDYQDGDWAAAAIPSIRYDFDNDFSWLSEYQFRKHESQDHQSQIRNALIWQKNDRLQLNAALTYSFTEQDPRFQAGVGLAYRY